MEDEKYSRNENVPSPPSKWMENTCLRCEKVFKFKCIPPDDGRFKRFCSTCRAYSTKRSNAVDYHRVMHENL